MGTNLVCLGSPRKRLALIHVDDVAAAIVQALQNPSTKGQVYVLSDPDTITVRNYANVCLRGRFKGLCIIHVPYLVMRAAGLMAALVKKATGFGPSLNRRRLLSVYRNIGASSALLHEHTGWQPAGGLLERLNKEADGVPTERISVDNQVLVS